MGDASANNGKFSINVLLVEDNPGDIRLTQEAFSECRGIINLSIVNDGEVAMSFLLHKGEYAASPRPSLILLDLNLPRKDGRQVLAEIKADAALRIIPVVILTTSKAEEDILKTYDLHANCFLTKPVDLEEFIGLVKSLGNFWLSSVKLPGEK